MKDKCECGQELNYKISPFMDFEQRVCPNCGKVHFVDTAPIDWSKVTRERDYERN